MPGKTYKSGVDKKKLAKAKKGAARLGSTLFPRTSAKIRKRNKMLKDL